uniref:rhomboid family intramembrane serine protease n=1 Tax=Trichocoleus desertorum TaxID=1481672 RepID=UPI0025B5FE6B|nr:rhomboid family intramembrane serine protease [Trichocoleus desertorum]
MKNDDKSAIARELRSHALILGSFIVCIWLLEIIDLFVFRNALNLYGIRPRSISGLWGILFAPFLHGGLGHLMANTIPFLVLGWFVMLREISDFFIVSLITILASGLGVWLFGSANSIHIGASGVVFGYFGFLVSRGYFERSMVGIAVSLLVGTLYGSLIWGVLPIRNGISWEGHLFGFLGGLLAARLLARRKKSI